MSNKDRTANVAKQFKCPLQSASIQTFSTGSSSTITGTGTSGRSSGVWAAPTIQALQGKVQTLQQAINLTNAGGDDQLEQLAHKWTAAGREIAWALWDCVKDLDPGPDLWRYSGRVMNRAGWGGDEDDVPKKANNEGEEGGGEEEEGGAPEVQHTPGVMLRLLGIDPATLGWDEEEGDFIDV